MCGIISVVGKVIDPASLENAARALVHRGPDGHKIWTNPDKTVSLVHTRLSIIDLETGAQPLSNETKDLHGIVNGEFYDFERIRSSLVQHRFATRSDSEIAVHLYEDLGPACLKHLRGEFSFILWDEQNRTLFAARDRLGMKPLFYAEFQGGLYLASEVKALKALGIPMAWDESQIYDTTSFAVPFQPMAGGASKTLFRGICQLPAGHFLLWEQGRLRVHKYWDFEYPPEGMIDRYTAEEHSVRIYQALEDAVKTRLRADVPIACYLSGGLDSTAILALAAKHSPDRLRTFTMAFSEKAYDESDLAEESSRYYGADNQAVVVTPAAMADVFCDTVWHAESFLWNTNALSKYVLSRSVRDAGYKVILSGQGADEIFGGYESNKRDFRGDSQIPGPELPNFASRSLSRISRRLGWIPSQLYDSTRLSLTARQLFSDAWLSNFSERDGNLALLLDLDQMGRIDGRARLHQAMYIWNKSSLQDYILSAVGERQEMANSVEGRLPFLDHHLIEVAGAVPPNLLIKDNVEKFILRQAVKGLLPPSFAQRRKKPFFSPPASLVRNSPLNQMIFDTLSGPLPSFVDRAKVHAFLKSAPILGEEKFRTYHDAKDTQVMAADLALTYLSSLCVLGKQFGM